MVLAAAAASAQSFESVGERALGMGGAFVAVADDSTATWWNPAGLATGPFLDLSIARSDGSAAAFPASSTGVWSIALATPPLGVSYYRLRITDIQEGAATGQDEADREDTSARVASRSLLVRQFGATVLHTITTGVNVGATVKYVHGTAHVGGFDPTGPIDIPELLDAGEDLEDGVGDGTADVDLGALAVFGAVRLGATVRNLTSPRFGVMEIPRQARAGAAFDGAAAGWLPLMLSLDVDLNRYQAAAGDRRVIAVGAEHWVRERRVAIRGGARFNTVGAEDRTVTAGASVAARAGVFIDGHAAYGNEVSERGWGIAARVSF